MFVRRRIRRTGRGEFHVRLDRDERDVLQALPARLGSMLDSDDPAVGRLFPPAYPDDPEREAEYHRLMREDLIAEHRASLEILARTAQETRLDEEQLSAWLGAVNDLRLFLGTRLDVTEDTDFARIAPDDPLAPLYELYSYLTWLEGEVVEALAEGLAGG